MAGKPTYPKPMGAPKKEVDFEQLEKFCGYDFSLTTCAHFLKVSTETLERRIKEKTGLTFSAFKEPFLERLKGQISQAGLDEAINKRNTVILKMYLQKYLGFSDNVKQTNVEQLSDDAKFFIEEFKRIIKK